MINNKGTATIFLIALFAVLAGAIGILLECARYKGFQLYTKQLLDLAGNSIMAEYYRPLYDDYHIFYLAFSEKQDKEEYILSKAKESIDYGVKPIEKSLMGFKSPRRAFTAPDRYSIKVKEMEMALDNQGKFFKKQAVSYMKYKGIGKEQGEVEAVIDETERLRTSKEVIEEKLKCEECLSQKSEALLKLMELIDGVKIDEDGEVSVKKDFVKKMVIEKPTMHSVGINQIELWTKLQKKYVDVIQLQKEMKQCIQNLLRLRKEQEKFEDATIEIEETSKKEKEKKIKERESRIQQVSQDVKRESLSYDNKRKLFEELIQETRDYINKALEVTEKVEREEKGMRSQIRKYEQKLSSEMGNMESSLVRELKEDIHTMNGVTQDGFDLVEVKKVLQNNLSVLANVNISELADWKKPLELQLKVVENNCLLLKGYDMSKLTFMYREFSERKADSPVKRMKELLSQGLVPLVLPDNTELSEGELEMDLVPQSRVQDKSDFSFSKIREKRELLHELVTCFQRHNQMGRTVKEGIQDAADMFYMLSYEQEHFKCFLSKEERKEKKVLQYEQEFLISGRGTDKENLYEIIEELAVDRTFANFISILTDQKKKALARETAMAVVGGTGIAPLMHVTETLILLAWSLEEALVDVAGMLKEKRVNLIKSGSEFLVEYKDLLCASRDLIQEKANKLSSVKQGLTYSLFLKMRLFLNQGTDKIYRCMELINQNIVLRYDKAFRFENCIGQFWLSMKTDISNKFLFLQFANEVVKKNKFNWSYETEMQQSY
ncbi:DUF5702 domain-containing protein [[Clostridium] polysaccharolyticum]|uniref:Uncharacterized protein n=1 Tax=[Clostridium] polysaccharolyticum TaxID=29364 RepID=A0A1I0DB98_9FIRM|nr:DUF5702 domain-containing protein [[Clostridium] polysaccharolyticum]SET28845.1 hypothetical protein SAMN04487772_11368 [[Clostridium] polysaccharolyticum]